MNIDFNNIEKIYCRGRELKAFYINRHTVWEEDEEPIEEVTNEDFIHSETPPGFPLYEDFSNWTYCDVQPDLDYEEVSKVAGYSDVTSLEAFMRTSNGSYVHNYNNRKVIASDINMYVDSYKNATAKWMTIQARNNTFRAYPEGVIWGILGIDDTTPAFDAYLTCQGHNCDGIGSENMKTLWVSKYIRNSTSYPDYITYPQVLDDVQETGESSTHAHVLTLPTTYLDGEPLWGRDANLKDMTTGVNYVGGNMTTLRKIFGFGRYDTMIRCAVGGFQKNCFWATTGSMSTNLHGKTIRYNYEFDVNEHFSDCGPNITSFAVWTYVNGSGITPSSPYYYIENGELHSLCIDKWYWSGTVWKTNNSSTTLLAHNGNKVRLRGTDRYFFILIPENYKKSVNGQSAIYGIPKEELKLFEIDPNNPTVIPNADSPYILRSTLNGTIDPVGSTVGSGGNDRNLDLPSDSLGNAFTFNHVAPHYGWHKWSILVDYDDDEQDYYIAFLCDDHEYKRIWNNNMHGLGFDHTIMYGPIYTTNYTNTNGFQPSAMEIDWIRFTPKTFIRGNITWSGGSASNRPVSVTVSLKKGSTVVDTRVVTAAKNWTYTFTPDKYDAYNSEIEYSIDSSSVTGYISTVSGYNIKYSLVL